MPAAHTECVHEIDSIVHEMVHTALAGISVFGLVRAEQPAVVPGNHAILGLEVRHVLLHVLVYLGPQHGAAVNAIAQQDRRRATSEDLVSERQAVSRDEPAHLFGTQLRTHAVGKTCGSLHLCEVDEALVPPLNVDVVTLAEEQDHQWPQKGHAQAHRCYRQLSRQQGERHGQMRAAQQIAARGIGEVESPHLVDVVCERIECLAAVRVL
mmetsp:Transcript_25450/g.63018  ORF Transcript_25450/g.63018 Transcript_25450/m.63018 type:complete len:210 (+) Transcript_25450:1353-1982(+)